jgi:hypothetical protein
VFELIEAQEGPRRSHGLAQAAKPLWAQIRRRAGRWISEKPCHDDNDAFEAFVAGAATTLAGLLTKLAYFDELASEFETEWMLDECVNASVLIQSFAASLKNIGVQS